MAGLGFKPTFLRLLGYITNFFPLRAQIETSRVPTHVALYTSLISPGQMLPLPKGLNVFLIISECHEKTEEEAVARPRCCLWSTEDRELIPAGTRGSTNSVPFGMREVGGGTAILCPSVGLKESRQQCQGYVDVAAGVGGIRRRPQCDFAL